MPQILTYFYVNLAKLKIVFFFANLSYFLDKESTSRIHKRQKDKKQEYKPWDGKYTMSYLQKSLIY